MSKLTLMACCMKSIAISRPNNSPAIRVNRLIMEHAPKMASEKSRRAVQTQTLKTQRNTRYLSVTMKSIRMVLFNDAECWYHPVQAKNSFWPKSLRSLAKLNINVYINTVGSATPSMSRGCPPTIEWIIPQSAVDARVCTAVILPSITHNQSKLVSVNDNLKRQKDKEICIKYGPTCISFKLLPKRYNWNSRSKEYVCCWS